MEAEEKSNGPSQKSVAQIHFVLKGVRSPESRWQRNGGTVMSLYAIFSWLIFSPDNYDMIKRDIQGSNMLMTHLIMHYS